MSAIPLRRAMALPFSRPSKPIVRDAMPINLRPELPQNVRVVKDGDVYRLVPAVLCGRGFKGAA